MRPLLSACAALLLADGPAAAATYVVNPDGTGDFPTIQAAVDATVDGDVVELGNGTFSGPGNRRVSTLGRRITIRSSSGSAETCTLEGGGEDWVIELRNGSALHDVTVLDAKRGVWIVDEEGVLSGARIHGCLTGLVIGKGWRSTEIPTSATVADCVISGNGRWDVRGGGVYVKDDAVFERCVISGNLALVGGGVFIEGGHWENFATVSFASCTITGNLAEGGGGIQNGQMQRRFPAPLNLDRTILSGNFGADLAVHKLIDVVSITCSVIDVTQVIGALGAIEYGAGTLFGDPRFCDPIPWEDVPTTGGDLTLNAASPAASSPLCGLIGALGVGCGGTSVEGEMVTASWARVKSRYR